MSVKAAFDRVPYRRGPAEENALKCLGGLRSAYVPVLSSDNLWLRFAVRMLGELCQLAGGQKLTFQVGEPAGVSTPLRVVGAPPTELSAGTGEARLRPGETALLKQLGVTLRLPSRSATLRHALFTCQQVCERVAAGDKLWVERNGSVYVLPGLLDVAAGLEQGGGGSVVLLGSELASSRKAEEADSSPRASNAVVLCNVPQLDARDLEQLCDNRQVEPLSTETLLKRLGAQSLCIQAELSAGELAALKSSDRPLQLRIVLQPEHKPQAEAVRAETSLSAGTAGHIAPRPVGEHYGLAELRASGRRETRAKHAFAGQSARS